MRRRWKAGRTSRPRSQVGVVRGASGSQDPPGQGRPEWAPVGRGDRLPPPCGWGGSPTASSWGPGLLSQLTPGPGGKPAQVCVLPAGFSIAVAVKPWSRVCGRADRVCPQSSRETAKSRDALGETQTLCWLQGGGLASLALLWALHSQEGTRRAGVQPPNSKPTLAVCPVAHGPVGPTDVLRTSSCGVGEGTIKRREPRQYCGGGHSPGRDTHTEAVATRGRRCGVQRVWSGVRAKEGSRAGRGRTGLTQS